MNNEGLERLIGAHQEISSHLSKRSAEDHAYEVGGYSIAIECSTDPRAECPRVGCCNVGPGACDGSRPIESPVRWVRRGDLESCIE